MNTKENKKRRVNRCLAAIPVLQDWVKAAVIVAKNPCCGESPPLGEEFFKAPPPVPVSTTSALPREKKPVSHSPEQINPACARLNIWPLLQGKSAQPLLHRATVSLLRYSKETFLKEFLESISKIISHIMANIPLNIREI